MMLPRGLPPTLLCQSRSVDHLVIAAFFAICLRLAGESLAALALPPFDAPNLLKATAAGFLPASGSASGFPSICLFADSLFYHPAGICEEIAVFACSTRHSQ